MARKSGLGRGLDALIPVPEEIITDDHPTGPLEVATVDIVPNPRQPRHSINQDKLSELADSIKEHGVIQPLIVTHEKQTNHYVLIAGERRLRAAQLAGLDTVPVVLREASEQESLELALIENVQRADLTPLETAEAYHHMADEFHLSHEEIAQRLGKSRVTITNTMRLLRLPESVRQALAEEKITEGHARALLGLHSPQAQAAALATIIRNEMTVRQTESLIRKMNGSRTESTAKKTLPSELIDLQDRFQSKLGTRVQLKQSGSKSGGSIVIYYYSDEELNGLVGQIIGEM
jgi:ParB family chromosome partitioning protein